MATAPWVVSDDLWSWSNRSCLLEIEDGVIVRGELIYDAEALRQATAR
jgi:hypothetical protein